MDIKSIIVAITLALQILWPHQIPNAPQPAQNNQSESATVSQSNGNSPIALILDSKALEKAVETNKKTVQDLKWIFAGTNQRGLYIYEPIITQIIGSKTSAGSPEFAAALAAWQQHQGLTCSGVLDEECWHKMIEYLQNNRLKSRDYPPAEELLVAPISDFFDPTRPDELRKVHIRAYEAYKRMVAEARKDKAVAAAMSDAGNTEAKNYFKIISSWRSREYQESLRKQQGGNLGRVALAKFSAHFTGRALDIYVGGLPVSTDDKNRAKQIASPAYQWLVRNAERFGFRPYFYEPWHWEYIGDQSDSLQAQQ